MARGASDVHLRAGQSSRMRVAGCLVEGPQVGAPEVEAMLLGALDPDTRSRFERAPPT